MLTAKWRDFNLKIGNFCNQISVHVHIIMLFVGQEIVVEDTLINAS